MDVYYEDGVPTDFYAYTDEYGDYLIEGLDPGSYIIGTWNDQGLIDEWYDNVVLPGNSYGEGATVIDLTAADANGKNFALALGRSISGKVTRSGGVGLASVLVGVVDSEESGWAPWVSPLQTVPTSSGVCCPAPTR